MLETAKVLWGRFVGSVLGALAFFLRLLQMPLLRVVRWGQGLFFDIREQSLENLLAAQNGPLLVISHHPYSLTDPLLVGSHLRRPGHFVAKATLFGTPVRAFVLRNLMGMRPMHRTIDGAGLREMRENLEMVKELAEVLAAGGLVVIFPEGHSMRTRRKVDPIMDGAARIALAAQALLAERGSATEVKIMAVGQTYSDYLQPFRSTVTLTYGALMSALPYLAKDRKDRNAAYARLTEAMERELKAVVAEVPDSHAAFVEQVQKFYRIEEPDDRKRITAVAAAVRAHAASPEEIREVERDLTSYFQLARELRVRPGLERRPLSPWLWLAWPFAWLGFSLNYVPIRRVERSVTAETVHPTEVAYFQLSRGLRGVLVWNALLLVGVFLLAFSLSGAFGAASLITLGAATLQFACALAAVRWLRPVNATVWSSVRLPKFERYRSLGEKILSTLEAERTKVS